MVDVAVVGCGPAGCAAALTLRTSAVATTIIASVRSRERPTETAFLGCTNCCMPWGPVKRLLRASPATELSRLGGPLVRC